jgi:hypothetical protein
MFKTDVCVLRRRGYSLRQLSDMYGISKSTASLWTKNIELSQVGVDRVNANRKLNREIGHAVLHNKMLTRLARADTEASVLLESMAVNRSLNLAVLSILYQCEGAKESKSIRFTNSDPELIKLFLSTLRSSFSIDESKLHVCIHLHDYHNESEISKFWSIATSIPVVQFYKPFRKISNHAFKKEGYKGCVRIIYHDSHIARVLLSFAKRFNSLYI